MTTHPLPTLAAPSESPRMLPRLHTLWPLALFVLTLSFLVADRWHYLTHFGFVYTEADQATLWVQADDIAHGIFREPCFYGQAYNLPVEAWFAAPLILCGVPPGVALPLITVMLALLPFVALAVVAYRTGQRWIASAILLIPLALPVEYVVVSSIPRGFINGIALATPSLALWVFARSRWSFFFAGLFAVLALTANPNCSIALLAAGTFALLTHYRRREWYLFSALGIIAALPAPLLVALFYRTHPNAAVYHPKARAEFFWPVLRDTFLLPTGRFNFRGFDLFFADFIPITRQGWYMLVVLAVMPAALAVTRRYKAALAFLLAVLFTILTLGVERIHGSLSHVFYSGSRMYLALPVLFACFFVWMDRKKKSPFRFPTVAVVARTCLILALVGFALMRNLSMLNVPSPFVKETWPLSVETVASLTQDARVTTEMARKYDATLVLPADSRMTCFNEAGPLLAGRAFETLYPPFERRTFRVADERTHLHTAVLMYRPSFLQIGRALSAFPNSKMICYSPQLLLVRIDAPGKPGLDIAQTLGLTYRPHF